MSCIEIPTEISQMKALVVFRFNHNRVVRFPQTLGYMKQLQTVTFEGNPIGYPPRSILNLGWQSIRSYLAEPVNFLMKHYPQQSEGGAILDNTTPYGDSQTIVKMLSTVQTLLTDPIGRETFGHFLQKECSYENLLFWEAIENLRKQEAFLMSEDYLTEAIAIYSKFIVEDESGMVFEVNLPFELKEKCVNLLAAVEERMSRPSYNPQEEIVGGPSVEDIKQVLKEAQSSVFQLLAMDSYQRFSNSDEFRLFTKNSEPAREKKSV